MWILCVHVVTRVLLCDGRRCQKTPPMELSLATRSDTELQRIASTWLPQLMEARPDTAWQVWTDLVVMTIIGRTVRKHLFVFHKSQWNWKLSLFGACWFNRMLQQSSRNHDSLFWNIYSTSYVLRYYFKLCCVIDLSRGSEYNVAIRAMTVNGTGPQTAWMTVETFTSDLDGKTTSCFMYLALP